MSVKMFDDDIPIGSPFGAIHSTVTSHGRYRKGYFVFEGGSVHIYAEGNWCSFSYYVGGRGYYRRIEGRRYTDIGLSRKAGEFGREVLGRINVSEP